MTPSLSLLCRFVFMNVLGLALSAGMGTAALAYQDDSYRYDPSRRGCFDQHGNGIKAGLNAGWIDFDWKSIECSGLAGTRSIQGLNLTDFVGMGADLTGMDLRGVFFLRGDLRSIRLTNAVLSDGSGDWGSRAFFWNARLEFATLDSVAASTVEFVEAKLDHASLAQGDFSAGDFTRASLRDADLTGTNFTGAKLQGADLSGAKLSPETLFQGAEANAKTRLPFSQAEALARGMIFQSL